MCQTRWLVAALAALGVLASASLAPRRVEGAGWACGPEEIEWIDVGSVLQARCRAAPASAARPLEAGVSAPAPQRLAVGQKLALNQATELELAGISGIGPHLAASLVRARE